MSIDLHTEALLQRFEDFAADLDERAARNEQRKDVACEDALNSRHGRAA